MDAAACIGCGACVAACPNASAALFTGAKITHLGLLPQGQPERYARANRMVDPDQPKASAAAPTSANAKPSAPRRSRLEVIARMNRDYLIGKLRNPETFRDDTPEVLPLEGGRR